MGAAENLQGRLTTLRGWELHYEVGNWRQRQAPAEEPVPCLQSGQAQGRRRLTVDLPPGLAP